MNEKLDLTSLNKATETLRRALDKYAKDETDEFVLDACIQRFEYCYDSAKKIIKRYLKITADDPMEVENESLENIIRDAYTKGILKHGWDIWDGYRTNRNATSHGYNEKIAKQIVEQLPAFCSELYFLSESLKAKNETQI